jgi:replicative DNA helicase
MLELAPEEAVAREPPFSLNAERSVLGSVLIKPSVFDLLRLEMEVDDFFLPAHREIWDAMRAIRGREQPLDALMLVDELKARGLLARLDGGEGYLLTLANSVPTAENVDHYADVVQEKARLRRIITACAETMSRAYGQRATSEELLEDNSRAMTKIATSETADLVTIGDLTEPLMEEFEWRSQRVQAGESPITGIRFGITRLDAMTAGLQPEEVVTVAADTGGGKTALAVQAAIILTAEDNGVALIIQLEMPKKQVAERAFVHVGLVNSHRLKTGQLDYEDFKRLQTAAIELVKRRLYIVEQAFAMREVEAVVRRVRARHPTSKILVVLDYIQLMKTGGRDTRAQQIGDIAKGCKQLAKATKVTFILVSQLNRSGVKEDKRPTMHDLKESGDIEQASDIILLPHNPQQLDDGDVDIFIDKHRNGAKRCIRAHWTGRYYRFSDPEIQPEPDSRMVDP